MSKTPKPITEAQFKKKLSTLSPEKKDGLLLSLFKSSKTIQQSLTFYFEGKSYRDSILEAYEKKITRLFNPSERQLMTTGVDVSRIKELIDEAEAVIFTENDILTAFYESELYLHIASTATDFLSIYGGGPGEIYDMADLYFTRVCGFISSYIGCDCGAGQGLTGDEDLSWDFFIDHKDDLKEVIKKAGSCGEGLEDTMQSSFDMAESCVRTVYEEKV